MSQYHYEPLHGVIFVLVCITLQCLYFMIWKPWNARNPPLTLKALCTSFSVSPRVLVGWRLTAFVYMAILGGRQARAQPFVLAFYTIWSWWILTFYFLLSAIAGLRYIAQQQQADRPVPQAATAVKEATAANGGATALGDTQQKAAGAAKTPAEAGKGDSLAYVCVALLHYCMVAVLIVTSVLWLVLLPMAREMPPSPKRDYLLKMILCFDSYNQHGGNVLLVLLDLLLAQVPFRAYMMGYVGIVPLVYSCWAFIHHHRTGEWTYQFLDVKEPTAPIAYFALYATHVVFFLLVALLARMRDGLASAMLKRAQPSLHPQ